MSGQLDWLGYDETLQTLAIVIRSSSLDHAVFANKLYERLRSWSSEAKGKLQQAIPDLLPQLPCSLAMAGNDQAALSISAAADSPSTWRALLTTYQGANDLVGFLKIRDYMELHGYKPDISIMNLQLELLTSSKLFEDARILYDELHSRYGLEAEWRTKVIMLNACMQSNDLTYGQKVYDMCQEEPENIELHTAMMSWLVFSGCSINDKRIEVHHIKTLDAMLYAASLSHRWTVAEDLWARFQQDLYPTDKTYSHRLMAATMARYQDLAREILEESTTSGYADMLDAQALQTFLAAELNDRTENNELCLRVLQLLEKQPYPVTPTSLAVIVPHLISRKLYIKLESVLELSRTRQDWDSAFVIDLILQSLDTDAKTVWNLTILLRNQFWHDESYNETVKRALISRLADLNQPDLISRLFTTYANRLTGQLYITALQGAIKCRSLPLTSQIHKLLKMDTNVQFNVTVLNTLINAYARCNSTICFDLYQSLKRPSHASVSIIIDACSYLQMPSKATQIWRNLERQEFKFNDNNYASYVELWSKRGQLEYAITVLDGAEEIGGRAVSTLYNTTPAPHRHRVEEWAQRRVPELWNSLSREM